MCEIENEIYLSEKIARFIFQKGCYAASTGRVKYNAFMPDKKETSVFRIDNLACDEIWEIGQTVVAKVRQQNLKGRAEIVAWDVYDADLLIEPETSLHPLHPNNIRWTDQRSK